MNPLECFFSIDGHATLDRNLEVEYNNLLSLLILGDFCSACPQRQFHTRPGLASYFGGFYNAILYCLPVFTRSKNDPDSDVDSDLDLEILCKHSIWIAI